MEIFPSNSIYILAKGFFDTVTALKHAMVQGYFGSLNNTLNDVTHGNIVAIFSIIGLAIIGWRIKGWMFSYIMHRY